MTLPTLPAQAGWRALPSPSLEPEVAREGPEPPWAWCRQSTEPMRPGPFRNERLQGRWADEGVAGRGKEQETPRHLLSELSRVLAKRL